MLILALIQAARSAAENFTRRALVSQGFQLAFDEFPCGREIILPRPPLISVTSITYTDADGAAQTLTASNYSVDIRNTPGRLVLKNDYSWPETDDIPNAVVVAYTAGYGTTPSSVPQGLRVAIRYLVTHWFENRGTLNIGNIANELPGTAEALLWQFRVPSAF